MILKTKISHLRFVVFSEPVGLDFVEPLGVQTRRRKSRRDKILLTGGFNLRTRDTMHSLQVPQGRHFGEMIMSSLRDLETKLFLLLRRLKSTVNKVLSLRDIWLRRASLRSSSPLIQHCYFLFLIFFNIIFNH